MTLQQALSPVIGLAFNVATQIIACRSSGRLLSSVYRGFAAGAAACALACGFSPDLLASLTTYAALGYCYFHFINLGETARRIRIVREMSEAGPEGLSRQEVLARYNAESMLRARFARLLNNSQVVEKEGRYYIGKPAVLYMAKAISLMKLILFGRTSGSRG